MARLHKNWWPSSKPRRRTTERLEGVDHLQGTIKTRPSKRKPWRPICSKLQPLVPLGGFIDRSQVKYSFKDDKVEALFKMLDKGGQLKPPEPRNPEDVGKTDDPRYCLY